MHALWRIARCRAIPRLSKQPDVGLGTPVPQLRTHRGSGHPEEPSTAFAGQVVANRPEID